MHEDELSESWRYDVAGTFFSLPFHVLPNRMRYALKPMKYGRTAHGVGVTCSKNKLKIRGEGKNTVSEDSFSTSC